LVSRLHPGCISIGWKRLNFNPLKN